jgi:hypothetical protein
MDSVVVYSTSPCLMWAYLVETVLVNLKVALKIMFYLRYIYDEGATLIHVVRIQFVS